MILLGPGSMVTALPRSHMNVSLPFEETIGQTTGTMPLALYPVQKTQLLHYTYTRVQAYEGSYSTHVLKQQEKRL